MRMINLIYFDYILSSVVQYICMIKVYTHDDNQLDPLCLYIKQNIAVSVYD
jgi:hypothetical protein